MIYLCDCHDSKKKFDLRKARDGKGKMQPTKVIGDGICTYCGHYAVAKSYNKYDDIKTKALTLNPSHGENLNLQTYDEGYVKYLSRTVPWDFNKYSNWNRSEA